MRRSIDKCVKFLLILFACSLISPSINAKDKDIPIDNEGGWEEKKRSASSESPIVASLEDGCLILQSDGLQSDITICITNASIVNYETTRLASETDYIRIDLNGLESGTYFLVVTNERGGRLSGCFDL